MSSSDPFSAPASDSWSNKTKEGDFVLGFLGGFFCGCIGLLVLLVTSTGERTRQGAWAGFGVSLVLGVALRLLEVVLS